jgi:hypothetical protein
MKMLIVIHFRLMKNLSICAAEQAALICVQYLCA